MLRPGFEGATSVIAQSFGQVESGEDPVNSALGDFAAQFGLPVIAQVEVAEHIPERLLAATITAPRDPEVKYLDTFEVLEQTKERLGELGLLWTGISIIAAHRAHAPRVQRQANLIGIPNIVPEDLPELYDSSSTQWWTRGPLLWRLHEAIGRPVLKARHRL